MNYEKIYFTLVENAKTRILVSGFERHHVIPKSLGGSNEKTNIVRLTYREHFIAHKLLTRMHKTDLIAYKKMTYAMWILSRRFLKDSLVRITSREFASVREEFSKYNPSKCEERKRRFKENHKNGMYKYDYAKVGSSLKNTLSKLSKEELSLRSKKSFASCDQVAKGDAIKKGKASFIKATFESGEDVEFWTYESFEKIGLSVEHVRKILKYKNGIDTKNKIKFEYLIKYTGGNKWMSKKSQLGNLEI